MGIDLAGKWTTTARGNKYVVTLQDYYSKFLFSQPLPDTKTETITSYLRLLFESREFKTFARDLGVDLEFASIGHHQTNGMVERAIRTIESMLRTSCEEQSQWDTALPSVVACYNSTPHHTTKVSPHLLMFGVEAETDLDKFFAITHTPVDRRTLHTHVTENAVKSQLKQKSTYDRVTRCESITVGDRVL